MSYRSAFSAWVFGAKIMMMVVASLACAPVAAVAQELHVKIDEAQLVRLSSPGAEVIVGNPSIADVAVRSSKLLVITGKSFGLTNIIVLDAKGEEIFSQKISVNADKRSMVILRKGTLRYSLHCTPVCQSPLVVGDEPNYFDTVNKATISKFSAASAVLQGGPVAASGGN